MAKETCGIATWRLKRRQYWTAIPIYRIRTKRALCIGVLDHLDTPVDHSQIIYTHNHPISPASRFRHPPTFRYRHTGAAVRRKPRPDVAYVTTKMGMKMPGVLSILSLIQGHTSTGTADGQIGGTSLAMRRQGRRQSDHHGNGWHGSSRQSPSSESLTHYENSRNNMEHYDDYRSKKGMFDSGSANPHRRMNGRINGARHLRTSHRLGYKYPDVSMGHNNGNMLPPGGHYQQKHWPEGPQFGGPQPNRNYRFGSTKTFKMSADQRKMARAIFFQNTGILEIMVRIAPYVGHRGSLGAPSIRPTLTLTLPCGVTCPFSDLRRFFNVCA